MHDSLIETTAEKIIHVPDIIPIFPLPKTILLPGELLPLHIFEHRYRDMIRDAMASLRVIGMVELRPGFETDYHGAPPVEEVGCLGVIGQHKELADGRFLIWLFGIERFTITEELEVHTRYRQARVHYNGIDQQSGERSRIDPMRREIIEQLPTVAEIDEASKQEIAKQIGGIDDSQLIALACKILELDSTRKRALLEAGSLEERFVMICEDLYAHLEISPSFGGLEPGLLN